MGLDTTFRGAFSSQSWYLWISWVGFKSIISDSDVAKISVIGIGMKTQAGVAQKMFDVLAEKNINLKVISTSEIKISVLIEAAYMELAARSLHTAFNLDESK